MHFAMPPRKSSRPPPYAMRNSRSFNLPRAFRRRDYRFLAILIAGCFSIICFLTYMFSSGGSSADYIPAGSAPVVIVTVFPMSAEAEFVEKIKKNRNDYAMRQGYATFFASATDYRSLLNDQPLTWSKVPAVRHAMTKYPGASFAWYLEPTALIMNQELSLIDHIMNKERLESLMITNEPVVPPDSVIRTFDHLKGDRIDFVISQDHDGLSQSSFIVRRGEWAKYFLDAWFDPLYRSYNFQKAEGHALEHIVQWHGTILAKLALVPQRTFNSYTIDTTGNNAKGMYQDKDFVANFPKCDAERPNCLELMEPYFERLDGGKKSE
ncbi:alpha-1,6-mannosyltransferase [Mytilinidion resinicola]|uniref:Alpha-1,6-mannosyltransferase n=1 Tax=Mytilinidion resinicola TaxID=574789 RepID=A0A6A6Y676_9PEZI|nr:alpha-1,6-mannosyltransferase [Mytilinidion resinicola]KAF2803514.1 alpha-1,6-mannosyltransferase [Mytilinidion resinicola]